MIPILFPAEATDFTTNGLGRLSDATDCIVLEERNGAYELTMTYPVTGIHFGEITHSRIIYAQPADEKNKQPFRIYSISKPLNGITEIKARHISYQMSYIPVVPFSASSAPGALLGLKNHAAESCPFAFQTDKSNAGTFSVEEPASMRSLLGGCQGSVLDVYGGEWEFDMYDAILHGDRGEDRNITLRYGKNITDIRQEENIANTYTGVMPYWKGMVAEEGEESGEETEALVMLPERVLHSSNAANFPFQRTIPLDLSDKYENEPTEEQLRATAQSYMTSNNIGVPSVTIEVSFIPLWQTEEYKDIASLERVNLCDTVSVEFVKLGISAKAKVVKTEYDVLKERYRSIEIGESRTSFAQVVNSDMEQKTEELNKKASVFEVLMKAEIDRATKLLKNPGESHVRFYKEDPEQGMILGSGAMEDPEGILIMDTTDAATAVDVLIFNKSGIGFSHNGVNGDYVYSWTLDGHFTTEFIATWELMVDIIRMYGLMEIHKNAEATYDDNEVLIDPVGGYIGYGQGRIDNNTTTDGIMLSSTGELDGSQRTNNRYVIVTTAGARIQAGDQAFYLTDNLVEGNPSGNANLNAIGDFTLKIGGLKLLDGNTEYTGADATYTFGNGSLQTYRGFVIAGSGAYGVTEAEIQMGRGNITINNGVVTAITPWTAASLQNELDGIVNAKVSKSGDTMTGFLVLHANPTSSMHAATKQYVDNAISSASNVAVFG